MNLLGIDFGTTKTLAARWDARTQTARTIRLGRGSDAIPTTVYADKSGKLEFGDDADDMRALDAAGWKGRIKRDLGKGASIVLHGKSYKVVHLVSRFLGYVRQRIEKEVFHGKIDHTVITVPALYGPSERSELKDAAALAGLRSVELADEPVAAGRAFLHDKAGTELGDQVLVFDWGGGTLDLALVERRDGSFYLNHDWIGGEKNLGGEDIDDAMIEGVDGICAESQGRIEEQEDERQTQIRRNLKEGKELLSRKTNHKFRLPYKRPQEFSWSRAEFEKFTASITDQAIDCLSKQVQKIRAKGVKPQQVLLVGGSSNMPVVRRRIETELGLKALVWENSQTAVALGAATIGPAMKETHTPDGKEPFEVECPHCEELVEVAGEGEYDALTAARTLLLAMLIIKPLRPPENDLHRNQRIKPVINESSSMHRLPKEHGKKTLLELAVRWNDSAYLVFAQPVGKETDLEQIMRESHVEVTPSLWVKNISNQPLNRIQVTGAYDGSNFSVSMPKPTPVLEAGEEVELHRIALDFDVNDGMVLKVTWFGEEAYGCKIVVDFANMEAPLPHLPIAVFLKDGTFSGKVLQLYNGSSKEIKNLLFTKSNEATYKLESLPPGGPCSIGWLEFSDSSNLKSGDVVEITKAKHRGTVVVIP